MTLSSNSITPLSDSPGWATGASNDLVSFDSENAERNGSQSKILTFSERAPVSLATLKRDRIQFDGAEAISIGQALCLALITAQRRQRLNPAGDLASAVPSVTTDTVFVDPASRLGVTVNDPGDEPSAIQSVGRILSEIVPRDARPSLETKIIAKALASPPRFENLGEVSEALAAFEQLQGRELIQAVYERWKKGDVTARVTSSNTTLSSSDSRPTSSIRLGSPRLGAVVAAIVVIILMAGITAGFLMRRLPADDGNVTNTEGSTITVDTLPLLEARPIAPATTGLLTWSVAAAERPVMSLSPLSVVQPEPPAPRTPSRSVARIGRPAPSPPRPAIARVESPVISVAPVSRPTGNLPSPAPQFMGRAEVDTTPGSGTSDIVRTSDVIRSGDGVRTAIAPPTTEPAKTAPAPSRSVSDRFATTMTYSVRDLDVAPPIPVLPRLLAGLRPSSPGVRLDALQIAAVVEPDGTVYSVTAVNAPQNMSEFVLLSSALAVVKSWEFTPATKDGAPVRYQLIVPVWTLTKSAR
jgi:hypothetical protein